MIHCLFRLVMHLKKVCVWIALELAMQSSQIVQFLISKIQIYSYFLGWQRLDVLFASVWL